MIGIRPHSVHVSDAVLDDVARRLAQTRFPTEPDESDWVYGTSVRYMRDVVAYWRNGYDWRRSEAKLNRHPNFMATVGEYEVHFIMERGSGENPPALLLTHGWPGSVVEFLDVIDPLAHPERYGGRAEDSFTVIVPSLPGYGFSPAPRRPVNPRDIAAIWHRLMIENLQIPRFLAQGGDWGAQVTSFLALDFPRSVAAIHLNAAGLSAAPGEGGPLSEEELAWNRANEVKRATEAGYRTIQGTRPVTLAYGLTDSPAGLAAWILEKFQKWTVPGETVAPPFPLDDLLANVMLYWLAGPSAASWLYLYLFEPGARLLPAGQRIEVPTGIMLCPRDLVLPAPDAWLRRAYNMVHRRDAPQGGHFLAFEQPDLYVGEVRAFFRGYR